MRKEHKNPKGGLSAKGRAHFKRKEGKVSHQFSHFNLLLTVYEKKEFNVNDINGMWVDKKDLNNLGLPTLMKKVFNHINT